MYHQVAEGLPDKFVFDKVSRNTATVDIAPVRKRQAQAQVGLTKAESEAEGQCVDTDTDVEDAAEREDRVISGIAMSVAATSAADVKATIGPGVNQGPLRFLPPGRKMHVWWEYRHMQQQAGLPVASFNTFLRAMRQMNMAGLLRVRNVGHHAKCSMCEGYKKDLRQGSLSIQARERILELYTTHIVAQWQDRQIYENMQDLSRTCMLRLQEGNLWLALTISTSVLTVIVDGMDQAKLRVPRLLVHSHAFERLPRPAFHVQGIWAHGAGYQLAVTDADVMKDTAANLEVLCRLLSDISEIDIHPLPP